MDFDIFFFQTFETKHSKSKYASTTLPLALNLIKQGVVGRIQQRQAIVNPNARKRKVRGQVWIAELSEGQNKGRKRGREGRARSVG